MFSSRSFSIAAAAGQRRFAVSNRKAGKRAVLSLVGGDSVGIVSRMCNRVIVPANVQLGRTRMTRLGKDYGVLAELMIPAEETCDVLEYKLKQEFPGYIIGVKPAEDSPATKSSPSLQGGEMMAIMMSCEDEVGIVDKFARSLASQNCDLVNLVTEVKPMPHTGQDVFWLDAVVQMPEHMSLKSETTRKMIDSWESKLGAVINVAPLEDMAHKADETDISRKWADY